MPRHKGTNREIEVKLRVTDVPAMLHKLEGLRPDPAGGQPLRGRFTRRRAPEC